MRQNLYDLKRTGNHSSKKMIWPSLIGYTACSATYDVDRATVLRAQTKYSHRKIQEANWRFSNITVTSLQCFK